MKYPILYKLVCVFAFILLAGSVSGKKPIKTLIVTGQNNHNWQVSNVALKKIMEQSGRFVVDVSVSPAAGEDMSSFSPNFTAYQLVVVDYNGDSWIEATKQNFISFARNGGGIVIYHAADNAFSNWPEFNKICALGGWEGRDEKSGPYVYWLDGKLIKDSAPGPGGSHGKQHEYVLNARDEVHPIMKGLPKKWRHATDELYDRMRGPGNIQDILFTAYSDKSTNGSGREEPLMFTVNYEKARIFHTMLGHAGESLENNPAMQCTGFQITFLRGAEWAATGKVTIKVPEDFPTETRVTSRLDYK
jgi:type 1 glutamine amidotransferase